MTDTGIVRVVEIERLAALDDVNYDVAAPDAVKRLGIRRKTLDDERKKKRRALGLENSNGDDGQGRTVKIVDVLPSSDPIEGDRVATALAASSKTYAVLPDVVADAMALWVLHTWVVNKFTISPRLAITSPTKGCGKTTVLRFLNQLVRRPKRAGSISPPALFRAVEQFQPTILLDETEKYIEHGSDLHALINEGHAKGATVMRVLGEKLELREFAIFGALAFARNGRLPDDLEQRSIVVEMQRRLPNESLSELREDRCESLRNLARMCARWADDFADDIDGHDPDMGGLINRDADNWRPLFAIADVIGSDWPARIRESAAALAPRESESTGPMLLADIKAAFDDQGVDRLSSTDLCEALTAIEGHPWNDWRASKGASPKPLTPNQLAKLLRPFGVLTNTTIRIGAKVAKGYYRHQFEELWQRYLAAEGPKTGFERLQGNNADETGTSGPFQKVTEKSCYLSKGNSNSGVTFQECEKPPSNGHCYRVTDENPKNAPLREDVSAEDQKCSYCGKDGAELQVVYGADPVWLHRDCQDPWKAAQDLSIPPILRRRADPRADYDSEQRPVRPPAIASGPDDDLADFKIN